MDHYICLYSRQTLQIVVANTKDRHLANYQNYTIVLILIVGLNFSAIKKNPKPGLIFHTDRGSEYRGREFQKVNNRYGIIPSMSRAGKCTDNAEMNSFFHTLKGDLIKDSVFKTEKEMRNSIAGYIQHFYNKPRLHSSLNYMSPVEYEANIA